MSETGEIKIKVGDRLRDNDPRMGSGATRILVVTEILPHGVRAKDSFGRTFTYLRRRIHTDGKPRRSGLSLVRELSEE